MSWFFEPPAASPPAAVPGYVLNAHPGDDVELTCFQCGTDLRYNLGERSPIPPPVAVVVVVVVVVVVAVVVVVVVVVVVAVVLIVV